MSTVNVANVTNVINIASAKNIDATNTGTSIIVPIEPAFIYPVNFVFFELITLTGANGTWPIISIGQNSSTYDNILTATQITAMTVGGNVLKVSLGNLPFFDISSNPIYVNVSTASTTYSAMNFNVYMGLAKRTS